MNNLAQLWRTMQGHGLFLYTRTLGLTGRFHVEGRRNLDQALATQRPLLWCLWHGQMMAFVVYGDRLLDPTRFAAVIAGDDRGDTLGTLARRLGGRAYRVDMGGNPVAAGRAVLRVIQAMQEGSQSVIAPDGPDGPAFVPKAGVAYLARKARAVLIPTGVWTRQAIQLNRWDRYLVPLPFAHYQVALGEPITVEKDDDPEQLLETISRALHTVRARAQLLAGVRPWR